MANFQHHKGAVTGLEWHQEDSTVFASSGADDQVFILVVYILFLVHGKKMKLRVSSYFHSSFWWVILG